MAAMRERLMEAAFPEIEKRFKQVAGQPPPWKALLTALGTYPVADATCRVRTVNLRSSSVPVPGRDPTTTVRETTGTVPPHVRIRTVERFEEYELAGIATSTKVDNWAGRALRVGNAVLFSYLNRRFKPSRRQGSCALQDLPAALDKARVALRGYALVLLVSRTIHEELSGTDDLSQKVARALKGGTMAPVAMLSDPEAHVLRYGAGDVVVEIIQELAPHWDFGPSGSVELIALQEFAVVAEPPPPAYDLRLL